MTNRMPVAMAYSCVSRKKKKKKKLKIDVHASTHPLTTKSLHGLAASSGHGQTKIKQHRLQENGGQFDEGKTVPRWFSCQVWSLATQGPRTPRLSNDR